MSVLTGRKVLVTGGTGAIGGRVVEKLFLEHGAQVRVLARNLSRAAGVARFPVELVKGDITDPQTVRVATEGCDYVVHCAYNPRGEAHEQRRINLEGTRAVLEAALHQRVRRVVHASTCSVYGFVAPDGDLDERCERRRSGNPYGDSKIEAEELALGYAERHGLPVAVIQPTAVYGPGVPVWTASMLQRMKRARMFLVEGGSGLCNAVYVDDVAEGMLLALQRPEADGEAFLINGPEPTTWRSYFEHYERMLGVRATVAASAEEIERHYRAWARDNAPPSMLIEPWRLLREKDARKRLRQTREYQALRRWVRRVRPAGVPKPPRRNVTASAPGPATAVEPAIEPMSPEMVRFFQARPVFLIDKARRLLGYTPMFDLSAGMEMTEQWARWEGLLHSPEPRRLAG
ncbi:NAD-dependent epimerase/dehydratase family protein [Ectothiorhodospiraceae bacterium 2226]|nr:NAD-dependent epimerase/dehydratase family protein [Ectothiorhodospiraceae bacterium 2226]